jgi:hypothetical protein
MLSLLKDYWATVLFWLIAAGFAVSDIRSLTLQFIFWGLGGLCLLFPIHHALNKIAVIPSDLNPAPGKTSYNRTIKGVFMGMVLLTFGCCLGFIYFLVLPDDRTQIREWLHIGKITITDETKFQFFILDADKNPIQIFASQRAAPFVTFGSILIISDRTSIATLNSFARQKRQLIMNELKSELLKLNLDIDSEANVNWELKLSRNVVFDKNLTQQQFLNEILTINQGLAMARSILDKYL